MRKGSDFNLTPGCPDVSGKLTTAIQAAANDENFVTLEPGDYPLDAPVHVPIDHHQTRPWGVLARGVRLLTQYTEPDPMVLIEAVGNAQVRFLSIDGLGGRGQDCVQHGVMLKCVGTAASIYRFNLSRLAFEECDDAVQLYGDVFEGDVCWCWNGDNNCGLALVNDETQGGIISAINVVGGSYAQNRKDGIRTGGPQYKEPYDIALFGVYLGNNGRYSLYARAGLQLAKACRFENPWSDPATHDPTGTAVRASVYVQNFGTLEQCVGGGNGNGTTLVHGYLSGTLTLRECRMIGAAAKRLATVDGKTGNAFCDAIHCAPPVIEATSNVLVSVVP
jgi:hypothetical protein